MDSSERCGSSSLHETGMQDFVDCLNSVGLSDIPATGCYFTWSNKQGSSLRWAKLDRALSNGLWKTTHNSYVEFLPPGVSDHSPIVLSMHNLQMKRVRPFRYMNCWALSSHFRSLVLAIWSAPTHGNGICALITKLRSLKGPLRGLHKQEFNDLAARVSKAKSDLLECQKAMQSSPTDIAFVAHEKILLQKYLLLKKAEMRVLKQRAKVHHIKFNDSCTQFFYARIADRKSTSTIGAIIDAQGNYCKGAPKVAAAFLDYYQGLLGSDFPTTTLPDDIFQDGRVPNDSFSILLKPITPEEIKAALFSIHKNKSPGIDGYPSGFFKETWDITGPDFVAAVLDFFHNGSLPKQVNSTLIALIPKCKTPATVMDFRPISCCTTLYKTISKVLANRMKLVLPFLIGFEQAAFVENRDLFDNTMLAHELARKYSRNAISPRCIVKVDIRKAFDSVSWAFIRDFLVKFGFPPKFLKWIEACITTSHFSLNINGSTEGFFPGKRGLRQGDPLSPYLFVLSMEILSRLLRRLPVAPGFSYHPRCVRLNLTHLVFADDLLVFTRGDLPSVCAVADCLHVFAGYSGLTANPLKTNIYFGGVTSSLKRMITNSTGFSEGDFPFRYLGIPLFTSRLTSNMFLPLLEKIRSKLSHWANHMLSYAGKTQLINSVIFGLHNFWGASVILPRNIVKKIEKICKDFLWGIQNDRLKMVFKSWKSFCLPRKEGGVGIKEVLSWNKSQNLKWVWKLEHRPASVWVQWSKKYILKDQDFWTVNAKLDHSFCWKGLLALRDELLIFAGSTSHAKTLLAACTTGGRYSTGMMYEHMRTKSPLVHWHKTIWDFAVVPRTTFIGCLAAHDRLATLPNI